MLQDVPANYDVKTRLFEVKRPLLDVCNDEAIDLQAILPSARNRHQFYTDDFSGFAGPLQGDEHRAFRRPNLKHSSRAARGNKLIQVVPIFLEIGDSLVEVAVGWIANVCCVY